MTMTEESEGRMSDDREYVIEERGSGFRWFIVGAAIGAAVGLLFAPQSGERTRHELKRRARRLQAQAGEKLEDLSTDLQERGARLKDSVSDMVDDVSDTVREGRERVTRTAASARDEMERRLTDARSRRRAAIAGESSGNGE